MTLERIGAITLAADENKIMAAVIDNINGFAYFACGVTWDQGKVVKIRLSDFTKIDPAVTFAVGEYQAGSGVIDESNCFAYFGTCCTSDGKIYKIDLNTFTQLPTLGIPTGDDRAAAIDELNGFAYFGSTFLEPTTIYKIRLSDFSNYAQLTLSTGERQPECAAIDTTNGFVYFAVGTGGGTPFAPIKLVKVRLSDFTRVDALDLSPYGVGTNRIDAISIDNNKEYAYLSISGFPARIFKVRLSDLTLISILTLDIEANLQGYPETSVICQDFLYIGLDMYTSDWDDAPIRLVKIRLSDFSEVQHIDFNPEEKWPWGSEPSIIDLNKGFIYIGTYTSPAIIVKVYDSDIIGAAAVPYLPGRPPFRRTGASVSGGIECGRGKER